MPIEEKEEDLANTYTVPSHAPVTLLKNGDIVQEIEGANQIVAKFNRTTGHLEFASQHAANKLKGKILSAIGTINKGKDSSGLIVKTMALKGAPRDTPKNVPAKPRRHPMLGDTTPELVEWYFEYYPQEAYIRYGVFLDAKGNPIRKNVRRKLTETIDDRTGEYGLEEQNEGKGQKVGKNKWEKSAIAITVTEENLKNQIIARRATCITFQPNEVIGGFSVGDEEEAHEGADEDQQQEGGDE